LADALRASLAFARAHPDEAFETMRRHAQELDEDVIWSHVRLYVNDSTADLGAAGRAALAELARRTGGAELVVLGEPR
jgi:1,4-dihydroxy-6-naphthoate synthase